MLKKLHHHVARKPHNHLMRRWLWYRKWHGWRYHSHVHTAILVTYMFAVAAVVLLTFTNSSAESVMSNWDFSNPSEFSFNSNTVETSETSARLKALNYQSDANTMALYHADEDSGVKLMQFPME